MDLVYQIVLNIYVSRTKNQQQKKNDEDIRFRFIPFKLSFGLLDENCLWNDEMDKNVEPEEKHK